MFYVYGGCSTLITPESSTATLPWHCSGGWTLVWVTELSGLWARGAPGSKLTIQVTGKADKSWLFQQSFVLSAGIHQSGWGRPAKVCFDRGRVKCRSRGLALRAPRTDFEGAVFCREPYTVYWHISNCQRIRLMGSSKFCQFVTLVGMLLLFQLCLRALVFLHCRTGESQVQDLGVSDHLLQMSLEGIAVFCISSHKCGRLKVIRARPEITVTEYNPCTESLKKERKRHTVSACRVVRGVARKPQDLKMHMT